MGSRLVEHHQLPHAPGVGTIPSSGDLAVRLGEEPVKVLIAVESLVKSVHMSVDMVAFDGVDVETSRTEFSHLGDSYLGVKLSSATSYT
jgi:hypothetical protein